MISAQTLLRFVAWKTAFHPRVEPEGMLFRLML
jgi:hypothetical protein